MSHSDSLRISDLAADSPHLSEAMAHFLYQRVDGEDLARLDIPARSRFAADACTFMQVRAPGKPKIRILPLEGGTSGTLVEIINEDMPFLLDSTLAELNERGFTLALVSHPILAVERAPNGDLIRLAGAATGRELAPVQRESFIHLHLTNRLDDAQCTALEAALNGIYADIRAAVRDWLPMRTRLAEIATQYRANPPHLPADEIAEAVQFLDWVLADNFTFLGLREYRFADAAMQEDPIPSEGLGILRDPEVKVLRRGAELVVMTPEIRAFLKEPAPLFVAKANVKSRIHRRVYLDYLGIKLMDENGQLAGELRVVGLFTSTAYTGSTRSVPYLRHKVARVLEQAGFDSASHSGKALINVLETYPRDELFQMDVKTLFSFAMEVLALTERPRLRALARIDKFDRFVSVLVFVPKDRYDTQARIRIGDYLARVYDGHVSAAYPAYPEGPLARTHYIIGRRERATPQIERATLEDGIAALIRTWADGFRDAAHTLSKADETQDVARYAEAFNAAYREAFTPDDAIRDLHVLQTLKADHPFAFTLYRKKGDGERRANLKVFSHGQPIALSRRVPILENLGFTVINERTYAVTPHGAGGEGTYLHDMTLERASGGILDFATLEPPLLDALNRIFSGRLEGDRFNLLVTEAGITAREADIIRSYARYLRQIGLPYGQIYLAEVMARYPSAARGLIRIFDFKFNPDLSLDVETRWAKHQEAISTFLAEVDTVSSLEDDRILRKMLNLIQSTIRTNVYQKGEDGAERPTLAFKFTCAMVDSMPLPRPLYEIFVASPDVEGLHLRFGKVARGGLRWSDRPMDFRTEILGLVKAQQVKNAVIVPVGAKGGFVPKLLPPSTDRDAWFAEGTRAYKIFVSALLDLTDTIRGEDIIPPASTIRYDGDDPYLVVAADKGTATFSDTANGIADARGHWLSDAFASGGSAGYDHKKMGITARGAWEAVKRHFREIDRDIQNEAFTVAGVGDMSGDVFGNGMLLSPEIRLVAAFDHRDIFLDPAPDAATSLAERKRLFEKPRSSWQDYDRSLISHGGGIFSRAAKKIPLNDALRALLDLEGEDATPSEVMSAILKARVDLLWFGGIGTYLRASSETDAQAGDRANDAIRITGRDVRAKVIGEGANLGMTQAARIEAAQNGVRLNTDAIDNSAGVNSSDVEVNLKIALARPESDGRLTREARNTLLARMTDDVASLVLRNNYLQSLALSLTQRAGGVANSEMEALMHALEEAGRLDRAVEGLPSDSEIEMRTLRDAGLTRPELAVLLAYAKLALYDDLLASNMPDDPYFIEELRGYFPHEMQRLFPDAIDSHRLRREIISTQIANAVINRGGPGIITRLANRTGKMAPDIARAYVLARDVFSVLDINKRIDGLDAKIPGAAQLALYAQTTAFVTNCMVWFLRNADLSAGLTPLVARFRATTQAVAAEGANLLSEPAKAARRALIAEISGQGVPRSLAKAISDLPLRAVALDGTLVAEKTGISVIEAVKTLLDLSERLGIGLLHAQAEGIEANDPFERMALDRARAAIDEALRCIAINALINHGGDALSRTAQWAEAHSNALATTLETIHSMARGTLNQAKLTVLAGILGDLARE